MERKPYEHVYDYTSPQKKRCCSESYGIYCYYDWRSALASKSKCTKYFYEEMISPLLTLNNFSTFRYKIHRSFCFNMTEKVIEFLKLAEAFPCLHEISFTKRYNYATIRIFISAGLILVASSWYAYDPCVKGLNFMVCCAFYSNAVLKCVK